MSLLYVVKDDMEELVMLAPLRTIERAFRLHNEAVARIERSHGGILTLFRNDKAWPVAPTTKFVTVMEKTL